MNTLCLLKSLSPSMLKFVFYVSCVVEASEATGVACQCTAQDPLDAATISVLSALSGNGT